MSPDDADEIVDDIKPSNPRQLHIGIPLHANIIASTGIFQKDKLKQNEAQLRWFHCARLNANMMFSSASCHAFFPARCSKIPNTAFHLRFLDQFRLECTKLKWASMNFHEQDWKDNY